MRCANREVVSVSSLTLLRHRKEKLYYTIDYRVFMRIKI